MPTDRELLREYARHQSESAFAEFVRRHLNLIYSAALRETHGDTAQAEDIAQAVFTEAARKASRLGRHPAVAGWLYTCVRRIAANLRRAEGRRLRREQEVHAMNELLPADANESGWRRIRPVLDDAMHELSESDRAAVALRFFEGQSHEEVGLALGISETAARKRVDRALEKLRACLTRRGVTTTAAALSIALAANAAQVAPACLAATLANTSLAAATTGAATSSSLGIFALMNSAKLTLTAVSLVLLVVAGGTVVGFIRATSGHRSPAHSSQEPALLSDTPQRRAVGANTSVPSNRGTSIDADLAAALARVQAILDNPHPGLNAPNPAMAAAIAALGDRCAAAVPLLREALASSIPAVRRQAAEGLGLIGPPAKEAVPELLGMLRHAIQTDEVSQSLRSLTKIGPSPEILGDLAEIFKEQPMARHAMANVLPDMFEGQSSSIDSAFRPLLHDPDPDARRAAAYALSVTLSDQAGPEVIRVAIEALNSSASDLLADAQAPATVQERNRQTRNRALLMEALNTLAKAGKDPNDPQLRVTAAGLGAASSEAASALVNLVRSASSDDAREAALRLLSSLQPNLENEPAVSAFLQDYEQRTALAERANEGQASVTELTDGLKKSPGMIVAAANALARLGPDASAALPGLRDTLASLEPGADLSASARTEMFRARDAIADAIQQIAPDRPKPLFTLTDVTSILNLLNDQTTTDDDPSRHEKLRVAIQPVQAQINDQRLECTPEQMQQLLDAVKRTDEAAYSLVAAHVAKIDPKFFRPTAR